MNNLYDIVSYRPEHKRQVSALQTLLWSTDPDLGVRHLEWKYGENPYVKEPLIYLAFQGGELVGMRGFYGSKWELGSPAESHSLLVADDAVIAPAHRDRGLVTMIMRAAFEDLAKRGYDYVLNLSGGPVTVVGSLAMGWKSVGPLDPIGRQSGSPIHRRLRQFLERKPLLWRYARSPILHSAGENRPFAALDRKARIRLGGSIRIEREPSPEAMSELVTRIGHDGRIRHVRDAEFFAWRFRNPLGEYRFLYSGKSRLDGYLVLKSARPSAMESKRVKIVDLEATQSSSRSELLDAAIRLGRFPDLFAWGATLPHDTRSYLGSRDFKPVDLEWRARGCPCVLVRPVSPRPAGDWVLGNCRLSDLANWDMRMLYSMTG
jgi:hypothetical protein